MITIEFWTGGGRRTRDVEPFTTDFLVALPLSLRACKWPASVELVSLVRTRTHYAATFTVAPVGSSTPKAR